MYGVWWQDAEMAIAGMNGQWLGGRSLRTNWATGKGGGSTQRTQSSKSVDIVCSHLTVYRENSGSIWHVDYLSVLS